MSFKFKNHLKILYTFFLIILTNCQLKDSSNTHGIIFLENRAEKLIIKDSNKNDVIQIIGQPHSKSLNNDDEWIYIERVFYVLGASLIILLIYKCINEHINGEKKKIYEHHGLHVN